MPKPNGTMAIGPVHAFFITCITGWSLAGAVSAGEIHRAVKQVDLTALEQIVRGNPSVVNEVEVHGWTALHMVPVNLRSYKSKALAVTTFLIENGADVNAVDVDGDTPLHEAVGQGLPEIAKLLLDNGAELEIANEPSVGPHYIV
jgi:uncharacterized protein